MFDDKRDERRGGTVTVQLQPGRSEFELPRARAKNVARLLEELGLRQGTAIVARDGILLTPDVPLYPGQTLLVRKVMSSG
ncbi:MAG TPA: hypothetical protein H9991_01275 [Candidatus Mailhella excrementigallinarum]|nr:MAG: hypothetical protein DBY37_12085 [Desulfovibrionaceae bacterium]HIV64866.1 hypothetical protein [Candidatus Mailhella excrementigallinarum]